jgi:SH3 domain-containing YSC84-like protein 1
MRSIQVLAIVACFSLVGWAQNSNSSQSDKGINKELNNATQIIQQMTGPNATAGVPSAILQDAKCIAVVPNMVQAGFIVGGRHGTGVATCRTSSNQWSPPAPFSISGGSFGAQIGGQSIDLIMMVMNNKGKQQLESGKFKLGAGASATAGPVGQASTSAGSKAAILTYSHSEGAYAGATVKGAELQQDNSATKELYGQHVAFSKILNGQVQMPSDAQVHDFVNTVENAQQTAQAR